MQYYDVSHIDGMEWYGRENGKIWEATVRVHDYSWIGPVREVRWIKQGSLM